MYAEHNCSDSKEDDQFMKEFKRYRQFKPGTSDHDLIQADRSLDHSGSLKKVELNISSLDSEFMEDWDRYGLKSLSQVELYELNDVAGLYWIPNPFRNGHQRYLIKQCLGNYHNLPNRTNLDLHMNRDGVNLWQQAIDKKDMTEFNKLRWATIGYHYDWTNKVYNEKDFTPVPTDVDRISKLFARLIGYPKYSPEAGIINYYHLNSTLSGHQDHSEYNMTAPLVSISFGNAAVFLIGGQSKSVQPKALLLRSGDVVIMSGPSRLAYHAVPKIVPDLDQLKRVTTYDATTPHHDLYVNDSDWNDYFNYIKLNRINLNIRQVN